MSERERLPPDVRLDAQGNLIDDERETQRETRRVAARAAEMRQGCVVVVIVVIGAALGYWWIGGSPANRDSGAVRACTCSDGTAGTQHRGRDGLFEACECPSDPDRSAEVRPQSQEDLRTVAWIVGRGRELSAELSECFHGAQCTNFRAHTPGCRCPACRSARPMVPRNALACLREQAPKCESAIDGMRRERQTIPAAVRTAYVAMADCRRSEARYLRATIAFLEARPDAVRRARRRNGEWTEPLDWAEQSASDPAAAAFLSAGNEVSSEACGSRGVDEWLRQRFCCGREGLCSVSKLVSAVESGVPFERLDDELYLLPRDHDLCSDL